MNLPNWFEFRMRPEHFSMELYDVIERYARTCAELGAAEALRRRDPALPKSPESIRPAHYD